MCVCWVGILAVCLVGVLDGCAGCVLSGCVLGGCVGWVRPVHRKLEWLLLERSLGTQIVQDLVSYPRRWLSEESQVEEYMEFLLVRGSRASTQTPKN